MRSLTVLLVAVALAGCGGEGVTPADEGRLKVAAGVRSISKTDTRTGLSYTVQTSDLGSTLSVAATRDLPAGVRTQLEGRRLSATCTVPGATVAQPLAQTWPDLIKPFRTALQTKQPVRIADRVTTCTLRLAGSGGAPFSRVRLR